VNVVIFGATGMLGWGTLLECLEDARVRSVLAVVRRTTGISHPKLTELLHQDFFHYEAVQSRFRELDACFFCLGVSSVGMTEADYHRMTYDLTLAAAQSLVAANPGMTFCYISGAGTDSSAQGRSMWARVKGKTENALLALPFKAAFMLRPGYIQPVKGVRSSTGWYQAFYTVMRPLYPLLRRVAPKVVTTTANVGKAMIALADHGFARRILEPADINALATRTS
jgi:uncharacterized protein YbjT (DUF2867 family)